MLDTYGVSRASKFFAANLEKLRFAQSDPPPSQAAFAKTVGLPQRTYNRITRGDVDASLETVSTVAIALHLAEWQLLVEGFNPTQPPELAAMSERERQFYAQLRELAKSLNIKN